MIASQKKKKNCLTGIYIYIFALGRKILHDNLVKDWKWSEGEESEVTLKQLQLCTFMTQAFTECQLGAVHRLQS